MASSSAIFFFFFLVTLLSSTFITTACNTCKPPPVPCKPTPSPAPPTPSKAPPTPSPAPIKPAACPKDTLKLGVCGDLLGGLVNIIVGTPPSSKCCSIISGLADLEAAVCLCTAIKANVLGINLNVPVSLSLIITACGKSVPDGFQCK